MKAFIEIKQAGVKSLLAISTITSVIDRQEAGCSIVVNSTLSTYGIGHVLNTETSYTEILLLIEQAQM